MHATAILKWDESKHPRDPGGKDGGRFIPAGSGGSSAEARAQALGSAQARRQRKGKAFRPHLTPAQREMQIELARQTKKPVHTVKTAEEAVALVLQGENVEIQDTKHVHTVLKQLAEFAIEAKKQGKDAPGFDPCTITVKGVSLFCTEKLKTKEFPHGIPRIEMPQFKSKNPISGSEADKLPRDDKGEVDASQAFLRHLEDAGVKTNPNDSIPARKLKASQAEMEGTKVAGMMLSDRDPKKAKIWVSKDGYVIDGHHTWAAAVGRDAEDGNLDNDTKMDVVTVDLPMSTVYHLSVEWTKKFGLPAAGVKKQDIVIKSEELQIVLGEVYSPMRPDAQGEYMTAEHIRKMAHEFLRSGKMGSIDVMHGNKLVTGASVVESFVSDEGDTRFIPGSWVVGVHVPDPTLWGAIKKGEINGFSMEALVTRHDMEVEVEIPPIVTGMTSKGDDGHVHTFFVSYDERGQFKGGVTDAINGHVHSIVAGTHTQDAAGHRHRFSSVDSIRIME